MVIGGISVLPSFNALRLLFKIKINRAIFYSISGLIIIMIILIIGLLFYVILPGFYLVISFYIALWVVIVYIGIRYLKYKECQRCGNVLTKEEMAECSQCRRLICQNCLDTEFNVCTACKTNYVMRLKMAEKQKAQQAQTQQVVIQQAPQTQISQAPNGMKHCIHCGKLIKSIAQFCEVCGKEQ